MGPDSAPSSARIEPLSIASAPLLVTLVNSAYRGDSGRQGWTTESDLLEGVRIHLADAENLLRAPDKQVLGLWVAGVLRGCVCLEQSPPKTAYLGMLTVDPTAQRGGLGKRLLQEAESWVSRNWPWVHAIEMTVISLRSELTAYYERRGYTRTGERRAFPGYADPERFGVPLRSDLEFVVLRKSISPDS